MIRYILLLLLSLLLSLAIVELTIGTVLGFPVYNVKYKVHYRQGAEAWTNVRKPHAEIYNVEGTNVTEYNNYGLPGTDLNLADTCIVVLGSSYVEAMQYDPEDIATSVFQRNLDANGINRQVVNLGCSGHDPYDSWFRLHFYEKYLGISTEEVVLVINSDYRAWMTRHPHPLRFDFDEGFGKRNMSKSVRLLTTLRNSSSFAELVVNALKVKGENQDAQDDSQNPEKKDTPEPEALKPDLIAVLNAFNEEYDSFQVLSITNMVDFNSSLQQYCDQKSIPCRIQVLKKPELLINRSGHLNKEGNKALGNALWDIYRA